MDIGWRPAAHLILLDQDRMDRMSCPANPATLPHFWDTQPLVLLGLLVHKQWQRSFDNDLHRLVTNRFLFLCSSNSHPVYLVANLSRVDRAFVHPQYTDLQSLCQDRSAIHLHLSICQWNNFLPVQIKIPLSMVDLAQTVSEWKDVESNKEDEQYLGDICFSLRYVPNSGKVFL